MANAMAARTDKARLRVFKWSDLSSLSLGLRRNVFPGLMRLVHRFWLSRSNAFRGGTTDLGLAPVLSSLGPSCRQAPAGIGPVAAPLSVPLAMVRLVSRSPFCSPEEDPFLLLESAQRTIEWILFSHSGRPLRRTWIEHPYGEEEITLLEEEVLPAIARCMARVHQIDDALESEQLKEPLQLEEAAGREPLRAA